jgi:hypothetical protein
VIYDSRTLMRLSRGLPLRFQATLVVLSFIAVLFVTPAQNSNLLPPQWDDAVRQLADKVASAVSPAPATLSVNNISSIDAWTASTIGMLLERQLGRHSFFFSRSDSSTAASAVQLQFTLSESANQYLWVVQILTNPRDARSFPVMIVAVPKAQQIDSESDQQALALGRRFVWKQREKLLDFASVNDSSSGQPALLILEVNRLAIYDLAGSQWHQSRTIPIPTAASPTRDPRGTINAKDGIFSIDGFKCVGTPNLTESMHCEGGKAMQPPLKVVAIPGLPSSLGTSVPGRCREKYIELYSDEGDWTQRDSIQGYLVKVTISPAIVSGNAIGFDGPVMSLQPEPDTSAARVVVHNLKTGEYEAYIVTATCGN